MTNEFYITMAVIAILVIYLIMNGTIKLTPEEGFDARRFARPVLQQTGRVTRA